MSHFVNSIASAGNPNSEEEDVSEWDALAGEWDDIASGYTKCFFRHCLQHSLIPTTSSSTLSPAEPTTIRIVDFGCRTGLFIECLIEHYTKTDVPPEHVSIQILGIEASSSMIRVVQEKIRNYEWNADESKISVTAICTRPHSLPPESEIRCLLNEWHGTVDFIFACSVLSYLPTSTLAPTMIELSKLLKPCEGRFVHSDWLHDDPSSYISPVVDPRSEDLVPVRSAITIDLAICIFPLADLRMVSREIVQWNTSYCNGQSVQIGVAVRDDGVE